MRTNKIFLSVCFFFLGVFALNAQSGNVATGGDASGSGGSMSYSIGQIEYTTVSGSGGSSAQGLQHPFEILIVTGVEETSVNITASLYPNPATEFVILSLKNDPSNMNMSYAVYDVEGKFIVGQKIIQKEEAVSLSGQAKAVYYIKVLNGDEEIKTFKIIKN